MANIFTFSSPRLNLEWPVKAVLLIDDNVHICRSYGELMVQELENILLICTDSTSTSLELCKINYFDVVITDIQMSETMGYDLIPKVRKFLPAAFIIAMTCIKSPEELIRTGNAHPDGFVKKKHDPLHCVEILRSGLVSSEEKRKTALQSAKKGKGWWYRTRIRKAIGMSERAYQISRKRTAALVLLRTGKYSEKDVATLSDYSTPQKMRKSLGEIVDVLGIERTLTHFPAWSNNGCDTIGRMAKVRT